MSKNAQPDFSVAVKTCLLRHPRIRTVTALARELDLARNTVSIAINHPSMLPTVKASIRKHLRLAA